MYRRQYDLVTKLRLRLHWVCAAETRVIILFKAQCTIFRFCEFRAAIAEFSIVEQIRLKTLQNSNRLRFVCNMFSTKVNKWIASVARRREQKHGYSTKDEGNKPF